MNILPVFLINKTIHDLYTLFLPRNSVIKSNSKFKDIKHDGIKGLSKNNYKYSYFLTAPNCFGGSFSE
jgi:hypothetical protein